MDDESNGKVMAEKWTEGYIGPFFLENLIKSWTIGWKESDLNWLHDRHKSQKVISLKVFEGSKFQEIPGNLDTEDIVEKMNKNSIPK